MASSPMELVGQFILCKNTNQIPEGWKKKKHGEWFLGFHPSLPVMNFFTDKDSAQLGWILGWPISSDGIMIKDSFVMSGVTAKDRIIDDSLLEKSLYDNGGRWATVVLSPGVQRVYLDPCGSLAAVFSHRHEILSSTPTLVPYTKGCTDNIDLAEKLIIADQDSGYPFGLTPRLHVKRLLPNHFLDLKTWEAHRHWPKDELKVIKNTDEAVSEFVALLKNQISAVANSSLFYLPLTAGRDSRMLLACAKDVLENGILFTALMPTKGAKLDCQIVEKMSRDLGLNHTIVKFQKIKQYESDIFYYRTGSCVEGLSKYYECIFQNLEKRRAMFWGPAGELGRSFHWRSGDTEDSLISAKDTLLRLNKLLNGVIETEKDLLALAENWLDNLPVKNALTIWGLIYNEQYNGCWVGPKEYGYTHNKIRIWPFCHRRLIEIMMSLPTEYRKEKKFEVSVIKSQWPELLEFSFNWPMGWQRGLFFISRRIQSFWNNVSLSWQ